jgi:uncharacterized protein YceK
MSNKNKEVLNTVTGFIILIMLVVFVLTGCSTAVPVTAKFPDAPGKLATTTCPNLQQLNDGAKLSDVANTVTINYGTYYECAVKVDTWIEWYNVQKSIYENAGK